MLVTPKPGFALTLENYFRERLHALAADFSPPPHNDTLWYMGSVLARFGNSEQLFSYDQGQISIRPLALLYKDAFETDAEWQRCLLLRQLGDLALFLGALFPERYARRGIKQEYFVGMGGGAYDYLADNASHSRHVFSELANMFTKLLELIAHACAKQTLFDASDVLALYQRWRTTGDPRLSQQLQALGIHVADKGSLQ